VPIGECACGGVNINHWHDGVPFGMRLCREVRDPVQGVAQSRSCLSSRRASFSCLAEIAEDIGPGFLEVGVTLQSTLQHASDAVLGFAGLRATSALLQTK